MEKLDVKAIRECTSRSIEEVWNEYKKQNETAWVKYKLEVLINPTHMHISVISNQRTPISSIE